MIGLLKLSHLVRCVSCDRHTNILSKTGVHCSLFSPSCVSQMGIPFSFTQTTAAGSSQKRPHPLFVGCLLHDVRSTRNLNSEVMVVKWTKTEHTASPVTFYLAPCEDYTAAALNKAVARGIPTAVVRGMWGECFSVVWRSQQWASWLTSLSHGASHLQHYSFTSDERMKRDNCLPACEVQKENPQR